jgi:hypothetical protein
MTRTDNDTRDITESVGATALGVAAARAAETDSENGPRKASMQCSRGHPTKKSYVFSFSCHR